MSRVTLTCLPVLVIIVICPAAVTAGHPCNPEPFTEKTWGDLSGPDMHGYPKSKVRSARTIPGLDPTFGPGRSSQLLPPCLT